MSEDENARAKASGPRARARRWRSNTHVRVVARAAVLPLPRALPRLVVVAEPHVLVRDVGDVEQLRVDARARHARHLPAEVGAARIALRVVHGAEVGLQLELHDGRRRRRRRDARAEEERGGRRSFRIKHLPRGQRKILSRFHKISRACILITVHIFIPWVSS